MHELGLRGDQHHTRNMFSTDTGLRGFPVPSIMYWYPWSLFSNLAVELSSTLSHKKKKQEKKHNVSALQ